ncbi:MAG: PD40 domain-containing protein [Planctomycetes bacterium]|nr:PD40 domain-containing protein [Planctomycetota bacterium]
MTFLRSGRLLAIALDRTVEIWDVQEGFQLERLEGHLTSVRAMSVSPDDACLAVAAGDEIYFWDTEHFTETRRWDTFVERVGTIAFSPDGKRLAWAGYRAVRVLELASEKEVLRTDGTSAAWLDGQIAIREVGGTVRWHNGAEGGVRLGCSGHMAASPDGRFLAMLIGDEIAVWDSAVAREVIRFRFDGDQLCALAFDGDLVAAVGNRQCLHVWEILSGSEVLRFEPEGKTWCCGMAISPDGSVLASDLGDGTAMLWDLRPIASGGPETLWLALGGDAAAAYRAECGLAAMGQKAVAFLKKRLHLIPTDRSRTRELAGKLDDPRIEVRDAAAQELMRLGHLEELRLMLADAQSPEYRARLGHILAALEGPV